MCDELEIQLSYAIGVKEPTSIYIDTKGTEHPSIGKSNPSFISRRERENPTKKRNFNFRKPYCRNGTKPVNGIWGSRFGV